VAENGIVHLKIGSFFACSIYLCSILKYSVNRLGSNRQICQGTSVSTVCLFCGCNSLLTGLKFECSSICHVPKSIKPKTSHFNIALNTKYCRNLLSIMASLLSLYQQNRLKGVRSCRCLISHGEDEAIGSLLAIERSVCNIGFKQADLLQIRLLRLCTHPSCKKH
jgi:hypothetical protein